MKEQWCIATLDGEYLARMETVLDLYASEEDPENPVWSFDERPCVLHDHCLAPLPMEPGKPQREDYTYERNGTAVALMAYNIHTGERRVEVRERRTSNDYAEFMQALADSQPQAKTIRIIEDNLNTHKDGSFYTQFHHEEARRLSQKITHIYTPKHASWLNIIEIEFSVLIRQCLDRRIATVNHPTPKGGGFLVQRRGRFHSLPKRLFGQFLPY